jgi:ATP-dependent DNA helicase RecG
MNRSTQETAGSTQEMLGKNMEDILELLGRKAKKLGKNRIAIIKLIFQNPTVSSVEMAEHIGISPTAIDNNIKEMRDIFIRRIGPKKGGYWEIITE